MTLRRASKFVGLSRCKASRFRIISTSGLRRLLVRLGSYGSVASDSLIALEGLLAGSVFTDRDLLRPLIGRMTPACSSMANGGCEWGRGGDRLRSFLMAVLRVVLRVLLRMLLRMTMLRVNARADAFVVRSR